MSKMTRNPSLLFEVGSKLPTLVRCKEMKQSEMTTQEHD
jgi:hypothetical protein